MTHALQTRAFQAPSETSSISDIQRIVAWAGLDRPQFMDPAATPRDAAHQFLSGTRENGQYMAVIDENPNTGFHSMEEGFRGQQPRRVVLGGPVACLRKDFNGEVSCVYIDPMFRNRPLMVNAIDNLVAQANGRPPVPMPGAARLVA